jgi:hypothetical protein
MCFDKWSGLFLGGGSLWEAEEGIFMRFLALPNGSSSQDTFKRVFKHLDKKVFGESLYRGSKEILALVSDSCYQVNEDGKVLRATAKTGARKSGLCIVSA